MSLNFNAEQLEAIKTLINLITAPAEREELADGNIAYLNNFYVDDIENILQVDNEYATSVFESSSRTSSLTYDQIIELMTRGYDARQKEVVMAVGTKDDLIDYLLNEEFVESDKAELSTYSREQLIELVSLG